MNKFIYGLAVAVYITSMTSVVLADPGGEGNNTGCNGQGNPGSPCESGGNGGSNGGSQSGATGVGVGYGEGGSSVQGQTQESSNTNSATQGILVSDSSSIKYDNENSAASAASIYAQQCQSGLSGQVMDGGFSVINSDQFCDYINAAQVAMDAYYWELNNGPVVCSDIMSGSWVDGAYTDMCMSTKAQEYLDEYHENVDNALMLVQRTEAVGWVDRIAGQLIRPIALIAILILIL